MGLFEGSGGGCADHYRPVRRCAMKSWGSPVCPVCAEQIVKRIYDTTDAITGIAVERGVATVQSRDPLVGDWLVDGVPAGSVGEPLELPRDGGSVSVRARADTPWVRVGADSLDESCEIR